jgi:hypothetical protein
MTASAPFSKFKPGDRDDFDAGLAHPLDGVRVALVRIDLAHGKAALITLSANKWQAERHGR